MSRLPLHDEFERSKLHHDREDMMKQWTLTAAVVIAALGFMTVMASAAQDPAPAPPAGAHGGGQTTDAPARAAVADNSAEPTPGDAGDAGDDHDGRRGKEPGRNQPPARRWAQEFESQYAQDLAWLRQRGLEKYADRLEAARKSDEAGNRMMVFSAHIRIRQLRRLWQERPEEAQRAVDEMRLGLHILDLAAEARKADGAEKQRLTQELEQALNRQFEARLAAQRSLLAAMERRLEELRQDISRQEELKSQIVQQRHSDQIGRAHV